MSCPEDGWEERMMREYGFPFAPYSVQRDLVLSIETSLESGRSGIFESPTGTGKTLSILCSTLSWLKRQDFPYPLMDECAGSTDNGGEKGKKGALSCEETLPKWIAEQYERQKVAEREDRISKVRLRLERMHERHRKRVKSLRKMQASLGRKRRKVHSAFVSERDAQSDIMREIGISDRIVSELSSSMCESDMMDPDYQTDEEETKDTNDGMIHSEKVGGRDQMCGGGDDDDDDDDDCEIKTFEEEILPHVRKIYYCSRTHSQLSQVIGTLKTTRFSAKEGFVRVAAVASRASLCIHSGVSKLPNVSMMNEKCMDMNASKDKKQRCPYRDEIAIEDVVDHMGENIMDIEDLHAAGQRFGGCPYYAARRAIPMSEIVFLPYNLILQPESRDALGIDLKGHIIVIDEAHNLVSSISDAIAQSLSLKVLSHADFQLKTYREMFEERLKPKKKRYIHEVHRIVRMLLDALKRELDEKGRVFTLNQFLAETRLDHIDLLKLRRFLQKSDFVKKMNGFTILRLEKQGLDQPHSSNQGTENSMYLIRTFVERLCNRSEDARIVLRTDRGGGEESGSIAFMLLNPFVYFRQIVAQARSVLLAGGTMEPMSEIVSLLFHDLPKSRLNIFQCGHVIPPESIAGFVLSSGPCNIEFEFTYAQRGNMEMVDELGRSLLNICCVVPNGLVCFLPSYSFLGVAIDRWKENGMFFKLSCRKQIFSEPKSSSEVEKVLSDYAESARREHSEVVDGISPHGAMMLCVVGGKLSEGIDFKDELGRCVVVVGLPFPNVHDVELRTRMEYLDASHVVDERMITGEEYYQNICMKAVNQSIGRAIRHAKDHASVVLVDKRFHHEKFQKSLPKWIRDSFRVVGSSFGANFRQMAAFHRRFQMATRSAV